MLAGPTNEVERQLVLRVVRQHGPVECEVLEVLQALVDREQGCERLRFGRPAPFNRLNEAPHRDFGDMPWAASTSPVAAGAGKAGQLVAVDRGQATPAAPSEGGASTGAGP